MRQQKVLLATRNKGKAREVRNILQELPLEILTLADVQDAPDVVEDGRTYRENALKKARALASWWQGPTLADDSGLEVDALGGLPGVMSARYAGEGATDEENNRKLLGNLERIPMEKRTARFRCVFALVHSEGEEWIAEGTCEGRITTEPRGTKGFGYDPIFEVPDLSKTFAEISPQKKNQISHRANALSKLRTIFEQILKNNAI